MNRVKLKSLMTITVVEENQLGLFDAPVPASRAKDPYSSIKAEDDLRSSGKLSEKRKAVYEALIQHPGCTAREIAEASGIDHPTVHKRISELEKIGLATRGPDAQGTRPCRISGKHCCVWYPLTGVGV